MKPRRGTKVWLAGAASLMSLLAGVVPAPAQTPRHAFPFIAPSAPMVLTRMLHRPLSDGHEVVSLRTYLLQFRPEGGRIRVDGLLLAVTVEAPPALKALVEMERRRGDEGMFPMWLDADGMLLPGAAPPPPDPERQRALERTAARIGAFGLAPADEQQAHAFVSGVASTRAGRTPWPRDLFRPTAKSRREVRALVLPDGEGEVTVDTEAQLDDGMLASYTRSTATELAGDRRLVTEHWTLAKAP